MQRSRIFTPAAWRRLNETYRVVDLEQDDSDEAFAAALPEAFAVIGQPTLDAAAIERAEQLRCVLNVEGNFFPNMDYAAAHQHGVAILGCGLAHAQAVAEYSLGLALDLCRGITRADREFRAGHRALRRRRLSRLGAAQPSRRRLHRLRTPRPGDAPPARAEPGGVRLRDQHRRERADAGG